MLGGVDWERMGEEKENVVRIEHPKEKVRFVKDGDDEDQATGGSINWSLC
jgi:hypothetical protein